MKPFLLATILLLSACAAPSGKDTLASADPFTPVRVVLETNCVHCHGDNRLSTMPSIHNTQALAKLIGTHWIVPGKPEGSRFFQVVTFPDEIPGAMPPSGHAISKREVQVLRDWIQTGAKLPASNITLHPRGELPRSI